MVEKNTALKRFVERQEYRHPENLSEDGTEIFVTTFMPAGKTLDDFHGLCERIGFGVDKNTGYTFDGRCQPGHEQRWEAYLYGPLDGSTSVRAIAGFNPNKNVVEIMWNGTMEAILAIFDCVEEGEVIPPQ